MRDGKIVFVAREIAREIVSGRGLGGNGAPVAVLGRESNRIDGRMAMEMN